jgi:hypothetical protein
MVWFRWMLKQMRGKTVDYIGRIKGFWSIRATKYWKRIDLVQGEWKLRVWTEINGPFLQPQLVRNYIKFNKFISGR